jgi:hypothetical protein
METEMPHIRVELPNQDRPTGKFVTNLVAE